MHPVSPSMRRIVLIAGAVFLGGCTDESPVEPTPVATELAAYHGSNHASVVALATLLRSTARYHNLDAALRDGFVLLHPCEERGDEEPVGAVYVKPDRLDGKIDPQEPEALIYEPPRHRKGNHKLVGVEFAILYTAWTESRPPQFLGNSFQREDEFGVWALHIWLWRYNPEGLFAESNPRVLCGE